ncbi:MAG: tetratricopeptide repeat protein [Saprospiraceae bacterium]|nr:tetratricopeptide repeat protein [Saprospiraceae bacterium]
MEANLQLGNVYFFNKNYDEAILQYNKVLKSLPEDEDAFKNLQYALREKGRQIAMLTGNVPLAKDYLKQSLGMNPDDLEATMLMGIAEGSTGNTEEAIKYFQKVLVKEPKNAQAYFNLGITYKNANQITKSDSFFNQAFMLDSKIYEKNGADKK